MRVAMTAVSCTVLARRTRQARLCEHEVRMESPTEKLQIVFDPLSSDDLIRFVADNVVNLNFARSRRLAP
jgi:hypothetical protein